MEQALGQVMTQLGFPAAGRGLPTDALRAELEAAARKLMSAEVDLRRLRVDPATSPDGSRRAEQDDELARVRKQLNFHIEQTAERIRRLRMIAAYALDPRSH